MLLVIGMRGTTLLPGVIGAMAAFTPLHSDSGLDTDSDGRFDYLVVNAKIDVGEAGTFLMEGSLHDAGFTFVVFTSNVTTLAVGPRTVPLWFLGLNINLSREDGPYIVDLSLHDSETSVFLDSDLHTTEAYSHLDFEEPSASFAPPHSDFGLDPDGDGIINYLVVNASVNVTGAGRFVVSGFLYDPTFTLGIFTRNLTNLQAGSHLVPLWFYGPAINISGVDGPYEVALNLSNADAPAFLDFDAHTTAAYGHLDFKGPPASLAPPHGDFGVDGDGDGLVTYLVVDVRVNVTEAGGYFLVGNLRDPLFTFSLSTVNGTVLDEGLQTVPLWFYGPSINASGVDGPYTVDLELSHLETLTRLDAGGHTTAAYGHLDFEGPEASLAPPHADFGLDTDGDGLFEQMVVATAVNVNEAGTYAVVGQFFLPGANDPLVGVNVTALDSGPHTVFIPFYGPALNGSGTGGPYSVNLALLDPVTFTFLDFGSHLTTPYFEARFEGPEALLSSPVSVVPTIDGVYAPGEWSDATQVDLGSIRGNAVPGFLLVKNDDDFLYVGYDATGDGTPGPLDGASIAFDTGNDGSRTSGGEDEFVQGSVFDQAHFIYTSFALFLVPEDSPYDSTLPNHPGLASARGFGPSDNSPADHRIYEFAVPLPLLGAKSGDTLGFLGGSHPLPGVRDGAAGGFGYSLWPAFTGAPLPPWGYGDLILVDATPPIVMITSPPAESLFAVDEISVSWSANDAGSGLDHFEVSLDGGSPLVLGAATTSHTFAGVADGSHTVNVTAVDRRGNTRTVLLALTVDTGPPTVSISSPAANAIVTSSEVVVTWAAVDATAGIDHFEVSLDGGAAITLPATATNHVFSGVADGPHTISVTAFDRAGNSMAVTVAVAVDTNVFSPTGPFGITLLVAIPAVIAVVAVAGFLWLRRRASRPRG